MGPLLVGLIPVALGVVLSPLAIMALIAILLSRLARVNGVAYLLGWTIGLAGLLALFGWIFQTLEVHRYGSPALWVSLLRLLLGIVLIVAAIWVYRRGANRIRRMAAAASGRDVAKAAALPGWLQSVSTFRPVRSFFLGVGLFVVNPVDASCAIIAALDITQAEVTTAQGIAVGIGFTVIGVLPIAVPVIWLLIARQRAQPALDAMRTWIAGHTHVLNAALLLVIGVLQLQKGVSTLF